MQVISRMILALKYKKKMSRRSNYSSTSLFKAWVTWVRFKIRMIVILSGSENWILNLRFLSRSDVGPEIMKQQHVSSEEGGAEEYKLQGHTQGPCLGIGCPANLSSFPNRQIIFLLQEMSELPWDEM